MWLASLSAIVLSLARVNVGDNSDNNQFIFPSIAGPNHNFAADLSLPLGSTQKFQWFTTLDSYYISLWQQIFNPANTYQIQTLYSVESGGTGQHSFNWQVQTYNTSISTSPVYFLWLNYEDPQGFTSHYFNITDRPQSSSSSSSSTTFTSSTSSATSIIASSTSSTPSQRSSDTAPTFPSSPSSNTETLKVGLGVGLGIGIPLVLIAGMWIGLKLVKQRQSSPHGMGSGVPLSQFPDTGYPPDSYPPPHESIDHANQIHEAPGKSHEYHEAPGERPLFELGSRES